MLIPSALTLCTVYPKNVGYFHAWNKMHKRAAPVTRPKICWDHPDPQKSETLFHDRLPRLGWLPCEQTGCSSASIPLDSRLLPLSPSNFCVKYLHLQLLCYLPDAGASRCGGVSQLFTAKSIRGSGGTVGL